MKNLLLCLVAAMLCMFQAGTALAIDLRVIIAADTVAAGGTFEASLAVSNLVAGREPSLGTFDLDVDFDPAVVAFSSVTFGNQLDVRRQGSIRDFDGTVPGHLNIYEISLDTPGDL